MRKPNISSIAVGCKKSLQPSVILSEHQQDAVETIKSRLSGPQPFVFLAGLAGTGKTELITHLGREHANVQFAAYTGKAASVLRQRGADNAVTLHRLLYHAPSKVKDRLGRDQLLWRRRDGKFNLDLIIADECSMLGGRLARDLIATGIKILVTGDPFQLPPINGQAYFNKPDFTLTEIHRQAAGSQPLQMATGIREDRCVKAQPYDIDRVLDADIVIVAFEKTRRDLNRRIRRGLGTKGHDPVVGDTVCCFRNNYATGVLNGTLWTVQGVTAFSEKIVVEFEPKLRTETLYLVRLELVDDIGNTATVTVLEDLFHGADPRNVPYEDGQDVFSYGYALTCHKAQGSEWDRVVVIDETNSPGFQLITGNLSLTQFRQRWLYTAVTRAKQHVVLMEPPQ